MDEIQSSIESPSGRQSFIPLKVNCTTVLLRIFVSKDTVNLLRRLMTRILKWLLFVALAAMAFFGVAVATNANRRERLWQFLSGETPTYDAKGQQENENNN